MRKNRPFIAGGFLLDYHDILMYSKIYQLHIDAYRCLASFLSADLIGKLGANPARSRHCIQRVTLE